MIYNLLLYFGIFFIVAGFVLFMYSEMKLREIDRQLAMNKRLDMAFRIAKEREGKWVMKKSKHFLT